MQYHRLAVAVTLAVFAHTAYAGLILPGTITAEATGPGGAVVSYPASVEGATDDGSGRPSHTVSCSPASGATFPLGTTTVSCTGSEGSTGSFLVSVSDTTGPALTLPFGVTVVTTASSEVVTYAASAVDAVDGTVPISCAPASGSSFALGTTAVACSAADSHGNSSSGSFNVVVASEPVPPGEGPRDQTFEAQAPYGARVAYVTGDSDDQEGRPGSGGCSPAPGSIFPLGMTAVVCPSGTFYISVVDTSAPTLDLPLPIEVHTSNAGGLAVSYSAIAYDLVEETVPISCSPASGSSFPLGTTTVTCSATDSLGNDSVGTFTIEVVLISTEAPLLTLPGNLTAEATGPAGAAVTYSASAVDDVDGTIPAVCTPPSGSTFGLNDEDDPWTTVTCSATDSSDNVATGSFTVTVVDTTPPALTLPGNLTFEATGPGGAFVTYSVSAVDLVSGSVPVDCTHASGQIMPIGTITVGCSATDGFGNSSVGTFDVSVVDTTPPAITVPADITLEATSFAGATATFTASAVDVVDGPRTVTCTPPSGSTFALGTTTVTCTASDTRGNEGSEAFDVNVVDTTPPVIVLLSVSPEELWSPTKQLLPVTVTAVVTDIADPAPTVRIYNVTADEPITTADWTITGLLTANLRADRLGTGIGQTYTLYIEAIDASGNRATGTVTVRVRHDQRGGRRQ